MIEVYWNMGKSNIEEWGKTNRNDLHVDDSVSVRFFVLVKGENGNAYNAVNEEMYCSIHEMAKIVADSCVDVRNSRESIFYGYKGRKSWRY